MESTAVMEPPAAPEAPAPISVDVSDDAYQSFEFPSRADQEEVPAPPPAEESKPQEAASAPDEDAEYASFRERYKDRIEKDEALQARIDQLANNKLGNKLQEERTKWQRERDEEQQEWETQTSVFNRLQSDDAYRREQVRQYGEPAVEKFETDYRAVLGQRRNASVIEEDRAAFVQQFNAAAIPEFVNTLKATLPVYGDLPEDVRSTIEGLKYDPNSNWLADGFTALAAGFKSVIDAKEREHARALSDARNAGMNEGLAGREDPGPVRADASPALSNADIISRYVDLNGNRDYSISREQYRQAMVAEGRGSEL